MGLLFINVKLSYDPRGIGQEYTIQFNKLEPFKVQTYIQIIFIWTLFWLKHFCYSPQKIFGTGVEFHIDIQHNCL